MKVVSIFFVIFAAIWTLLDPLGGLDLFSSYISAKVTLYVLFFLVSLGVALYWGGLLKRVGSKKNDVIEMGPTRAAFDQLAFLARSRTVIRGIGISLPALASENALNLIESLIVNHRVTVEIIICDPASPAIPVRPNEVYPHGKQPSVTANDTISTLRTFRSRLGVRDKPYFNVYVAQHPFGIGLLQSDDQVLWSPILANRSGATAPFQICLLQSELGKCLVEHFLTLRVKYSKVIPDN